MLSKIPAVGYLLIVVLGLATLSCQKKVDESFVTDDPE